MGHKDAMSRIASQDAKIDQANAPTYGAEAKHPKQNDDEASGTEWPNRPRAGEKKKPVTYHKKRTKLKRQQHHLCTRNDDQERSQRVLTSCR